MKSYQSFFFPGSKTKHVLEIMHAQLGEGSLEIPSGYVITNEIDVKRCDRLIENVSQFSSPCSIFVNHDGQDFPDFNVAPDRYEILCFIQITLLPSYNY